MDSVAKPTAQTHSRGFRARIRPDRVFSVLLIVSVIFCSVVIPAALTFGRWAAVLLMISAVIMLVAAPVMLVTLAKHQQSSTISRVCAAVTGGIAVKIMMFDKDEIFSVAYARHDGCWDSWWSWYTRSGHMILDPSGVVDPRSDAHFCYAWRPLDIELETLLVLQAGRWVSWESWQGMAHHNMHKTRNEVFHAAKLG